MRGSLANVLVERGFVSAAEMDDVLQRQVIFGGSIDTNVLEAGLIDEKSLAEVLAAVHELPVATPALLAQRDPRVVKLFPARLAEKYQVVPVVMKGRSLVILVATGLPAAVLDEIHFMLSLDLQPAIVTELRLKLLLQEWLGVEAEPRYQDLASRVGPFWKLSPHPQDLAPEALAAREALGQQPSQDERIQKALAGIDEANRREQERREKARTGAISLDEATAALEHIESRDELVNLILRFSRQFMEYVGLFVVNNGVVHGWDAVGGLEARERIRRVRMSAHAPSVFKTVIQTNAYHLGQVPASGSNREFLGALGREKPRNALILPIAVQNRLIGLLYGDSGRRTIRGVRIQELLVFMSRMSLAFEQLIRQMKHRKEEALPSGANTVQLAAPVGAQDAALDPELMATHALSAEPVPPPSPALSDEHTPETLQETTPGPDLARPSKQQTYEVTEPLFAEVTPPVAAVEPLVQAVDASQSLESQAVLLDRGSDEALGFHDSEDPIELAARDPIELERSSGAATEPENRQLREWVKARGAEAEPPVEGIAAALAQEHALHPPARADSEALRPGEERVTLEALDDLQISTVVDTEANVVVVDSPLLEPFHRIEPEKPLQTRLRNREPVALTGGVSVSSNSEPGFSEEIDLAPLSVTHAEPEPMPQGSPLVLPSADWPSSRPPLSSAAEAAPPAEAASAQMPASSTAVPAGPSLSHVVVALLGLDRAAAKAARLRLVQLGPEVLPRLAPHFPGRLWFHFSDETETIPPVQEHSELLACLVEIGEPAAALAIERLEDPEPLVRYYAVSLLGTILSQEAVPRLAGRLYDRDARVRLRAIDVLQAYSQTKAYADLLSSLRKALGGEDNDKKAIAAALLGNFKDTGAIQSLISLLKSRNKMVSRAAREALCYITKQDFGQSERKWFGWWKKNKEMSRIEWLIAGLRSSSRDIRFTSAQELTQIAQESFGYDYDAPKAARVEAILQWEEWWQEKGRTLKF